MSFEWFRSFEEMLDWIEQWLTFHPSGPTNVDNLSKNYYENVLRQVSNITGEWRANPTQIQIALDQLNLTLRGHAVCEWAGQFEEMISGSSDFAVEKRAYFRGSVIYEDDNQDSNLSRPIEPTEMEEFSDVDLWLYS